MLGGHVRWGGGGGRGERNRVGLMEWVKEIQGVIGKRNLNILFP